MRTQFVTDNAGKKVAVIIPFKDYQKIVEELEELEDIRLYDEAKKDKSERIPIEKAFKELDARRKRA